MPGKIMRASSMACVASSFNDIFCIDSDIAWIVLVSPWHLQSNGNVRSVGLFHGRPIRRRPGGTGCEIPRTS
ncbi:hypothetical protein [Vineibacter terrae]|uniref:hypothetical protein n=1 Tax=Vineibacter terrae TaxID=2586908 RepID=UPI0015B7304E|nr:hypothetical protein [Vineibacter terrae]